ncbi:MAG: PfkB family carbohydrate kinase [Bacteroidota bacterium]|nr:PfkB family carbohydrate kinase [Bacteroidota bacterium]
MTKEDLNSLFDSFNKKNVLIIGDAMIDAYMWGDIHRKSPEAPVPVVDIEKHENRLGGAANVALNIKSLGANPILCCVIGDDNNGIIFKELMQKEELITDGIIVSKNRRTTIKTRVIADNRHQIRVDEEDLHPINEEIKLLSIISNVIKKIDVVILQDYNKGVLTKKIIQSTIKVSREHNIPIVVDPKTKNYNSYYGASLFKPNLKEIQKGMKINFDSNNLIEVEEAVTKLRKMLNVEMILLTLSEKGICIKTEGQFSHHKVYPRKIIDVSGAGDTVISIASLCKTEKVEYKKLASFCNLAGGLVCEEVGVVPINKTRLIEEAKKII